MSTLRNSQPLKTLWFQNTPFFLHPHFSVVFLSFFAREKLRLLNLDPVMELLEPYYPPHGRPAINQTQILRSLVLMLDQGYTGITAWVEKLSSDSLLAFLISCTPDSLPPLGSYYDFIDRLWLQDKQFQKSGRKDLFPANKNRKPANKPGKGKKFPNRHPEITKIMAEEAVSRDEFPFYYEKLLHQAFRAAAILPSIQRGLINKDGATLSGDGICVHTHASPYGHPDLPIQNVCFDSANDNYSAYNFSESTHYLYFSAGSNKLLANGIYDINQIHWR